MQISEDMLKGFFNDFFYNFQHDKGDVDVNKCCNFITNSIEPAKTPYKSVETFLYNLFKDIIDGNPTNYEKEFLVIEKDVKIGWFRSEHFVMPECFITVLEALSRDETYKSLKYALIGFMYTILDNR